MPVFADGNSVNGVRSLETQTELLEYATNVFPKHLHALVEIGDLNGAVEEYSLGEPFTVFNVEENTNSSCFPVLQNEDIVAILEISENHGEYNSSLSVSFARELEDILNSRPIIIGTTNHPTFGDHWIIGHGYFTSPVDGNYVIVNNGWGNNNVWIEPSTTYLDGTIHFTN